MNSEYQTPPPIQTLIVIYGVNKVQALPASERYPIHCTAILLLLLLLS